MTFLTAAAVVIVPFSVTYYLLLLAKKGEKFIDTDEVHPSIRKIITQIQKGNFSENPSEEYKNLTVRAGIPSPHLENNYYVGCYRIMYEERLYGETYEPVFQLRKNENEIQVTYDEKKWLIRAITRSLARKKKSQESKEFAESRSLLESGKRRPNIPSTGIIVKDGL